MAEKLLKPPVIEEPVTPNGNIQATIPELTKKEKIKEVVAKEAVQPAVFEKPPTFEFAEEKISPNFDVLSLKSDKRDFDISLAAYNRGVIESIPTIDKMNGAEEYLKNTKFGYKALATNPEMIREFEDMGKIGAWETFKRLDKWGIVPYVGDISAIAEDVSIFKLIKKANAGDRLSPEEETKVQDFAMDMIEIDIRGQSMGGKFVEGAYRMPAFAIEFMTGGAILKQLGVKAAKKGIGVGIKAGVKKVIKGKVTRGVAKMTAEGFARTVLNPVGFQKKYVERKLNDSITITDKGEIFFKEGEEKPASTLIKAFSDVWIEQASETAGSYLFKPLGARISKKVPKGLKRVFDNLVRTEKGYSARAGMSKFGFDGLIEEMGEERLADFLRVSFDLDPEQGYSLDQYGAALFPEWEALLVEAGVIGFHGMVSRSGAKLMNRLANLEKADTPEAYQKIMDDVNHLTETQKENLLAEVKAKENVGQVKQYERELDFFEGTLKRAGMSEADAKQGRALHDAFITVSASKLGLSRQEIYEDFAPAVSRETIAPAKALEMTEDLYQESKTPEFKKWFGDSKVVDEKGKPQVVYHGTNAQFDAFSLENRNTGYLGTGFNFTTSKKTAKTFGENIIEAYISLQNPLDFTGKVKAKDAELLSKEFGYKISEGENAIDVSRLLATNIKTQEDSDKFVQSMEKVGYDGVIVGGVKGQKIILAFSPTQIKSPKSKAFDPTKPSMLEQGRKGFYDPISNMIGLLPDADRSTFLHESAHAFFEFYLRKLPNELDAVFKWSGITKPDNLDDITAQEYVRLQESFARGFETYLAEGKAPNSTLQKVFEDFRTWLLEIYDSILDIMSEGGFDFDLSNDIRNLFDDMLNVEVERELTIDEKMKDREPLLPKVYQTAKERISKLRRERNKIIKKYGTKKKADLAEVDALIKDLETVEEVKRPRRFVQVAEEQFQELPIAEVFEDKIRVTQESNRLFNKYDTPLSVQTASPTAKTLDEWAEDLDMSEEQVLKKIKQIGSQKAFVDKSIAEQKQSLESELVGTDIEAKMAETIEKIKADVKAQSVTQLQKEVIQRIKDMEIDRADKVRFLGKIQQAKTPASQRKIMFELLDMEQRFYEKQQRNIIHNRIEMLLRQTKPRKKEGITKGKYNYEENELFEELRRIDKLTQKDALKEADLYGQLQTDEVITEKEALVRQFTMYKGYGKSKGSLELFETVLKNLNRAITLARESKDETDFNDKLNKSLKVDEVLDSIEARKFKGDAKSVWTKALNAYRLGFTNIYSMLNSVAGKEIAEKYNPELQESRRNTATYNRLKDTIQDVMVIYNFKDPHRFIKMLDQYSQEEYHLTEQIERHGGRAIDHKFNRLGIIDIYNSLKNNDTKENYFRVYGESNVMELVNKIDEMDKVFGDLMMLQVQEYREGVNKKHIEQTGVDMGFIEKYWPRTSQKPKDTLLDNMRVQGALPGFSKARSAGWVIPIPADSWIKFSKHIAEAEQMMNLQDNWRELRQIFDSETVKSEIENKYGKKTNKVLRQQIDGISLNQLSTDLDEVSGFFGKVLGNWIKAKISLNPSVFVKQLISIGNYMEDVPVLEWNKYFAEGMIGGKKTFDYMFKIAPFLETRFKRGYSEDIERALTEGKKMATSKKMTEWLTSLVRMGDIGAIVYGGYPVIKSLEAQGMSTKDAVAEFEKRTLRAQQSGLSASLAPVQLSKNPFVNFFFAFKNTPTQYMRKMADATIMYYNGDISAGQFTKIMIIYGAMQPALFGVVTQFMRAILYDDDDDYMDDVISNIMTAPTNAVPIIGDMNKYAVNTMIANVTGGKKPWKMFSTPILGDIESWTGVIEKGADKGMDDMSVFDFIDLISLPAELGLGLPVQTIERPFKKRLAGKKKSRVTL